MECTSTSARPPQEPSGNPFGLDWVFSEEEPEPESNLNLGIDDADPTPKTCPATPVQEAEEEDDGWELVWEEGTPGELYFRDRSTGVKQPVPPQDEGPSQNPSDAAAATRDVGVDPTGPSQSQKQAALEAALRAGHNRAVSQMVLEYGMDLNTRLFGFQVISPLEWAVDHENSGLVRLFLDNGADADFPGYGARELDYGGPVLVRAMAKGNRELVELLVRRTSDRVILTRALGLAVDRRDVAMALLLLAHGARCDFEVGDRSWPQHGPDAGCYFYDISEPEEFMPPLVRAVKLGDVGLVRLLLKHGANANVGYHSLTAGVGIKNEFRCGRVIELAMEWGGQETVKLLLAAGADIDLAQPVWLVPGHDCPDVSRVVYQSVTARLRAAAAASKEVML